MRRLAFVTLALLAGMGSALCQTSPERAPGRPVETTPDITPPPLANPLDVPKWMGQTIEHILSDGADPDKAAPTRQ